MKVTTVVLILTLLLFSCKNKNFINDATGSFDCGIGQICKLKGQLEFLLGTNNASIAVLNSYDQCITLALAEEIFEKSDQWSEKLVVVVEGQAYEYINLSFGVISYKLLDRWVGSRSLCDTKEVILYVTKITQ